MTDSAPSPLALSDEEALTRACDLAFIAHHFELERALRGLLSRLAAPDGKAAT